MILTEISKLLKKDSGAGLNTYLHPDSANNIFEHLFQTALQLEHVFRDDQKQAELVCHLTVCIMLSPKTNMFPKIDDFMMQQLKSDPADLKALYLTLNCFQSVARICEQATCLSYFKRFSKMYKRAIGSWGSAQIYAFKILIRTFFVCLPKKMKAKHLAENDAMSKPEKWLGLGLGLIESGKVKEVEAETTRLVEGFEEDKHCLDYPKLVSDEPRHFYLFSF